MYNLKTKKLKRLTKNISIDTEANFSPDGKSIAFTSNRTGQVQIYIKNLETGKTKRATFKGTYNAKPVFSPDSKELALNSSSWKRLQISFTKHCNSRLNNYDTK